MPKQVQVIEKDINDGKVTSDTSSHPVGTVLGTVTGVASGVSAAYITGAAAGAAAGNILGPVGAIAGAIVGGIIGAEAGHEIAAQINPTEEDEYWRKAYITRPYAVNDITYESYWPAYRYGMEAYMEHVEGLPFDEIEPDLRNAWESRRGHSTMNWEEAQPAVRDAYERLRNRQPDGSLPSV